MVNSYYMQQLTLFLSFHSSRDDTVSSMQVRLPFTYRYQVPNIITATYTNFDMISCTCTNETDFAQIWQQSLLVCYLSNHVTFKIFKVLN